MTGGGSRVVVTGMGAVTSLGTGLAANWDAIVAGRSGVRQIRQFRSDDFPVRIGSEVDLDDLPDTDLGEEFRPYVTRSIKLGLVALEEAWGHASLYSTFDPWRAGLFVGASNFPVVSEDDYRWPTEALIGPDLTNYKAAYLAICRDMPHLLAQREIGMVSTLLAAPYALQGPCMTVQSACASATHAIGEAFQMIRHGHADIMVAGGADSMLSALCVTGFTLLDVTSTFQGDPTKACRPFDRKRDGLVLGEGAGLVILEGLSHAQNRGATIYAEVVGYGSSCDGYRFTDSHPEASGAVSSMRAALFDAGLEPEAVDYVNAHGTATIQNDRVETLAIKQVFGDRAYRVPVSSTKSQIGHLLCASGGVELVVAIEALRHGLLPPTINLDNPDPDCDLDYVPNHARPADLDIALSNSFGFGGQNGSLIVRRWPDSPPAAG